MADKGEFISKPLGPEWLTSFSKDSQFEDESGGRQGPNGRKFFPDKMKPRVPLEMLGRSKSSPVLTQEKNIPTIPKEVDVFTLLKEKNSFDKNFPTLNTRKPTTIGQPTSQPTTTTQSMTSVEKEPQTAWKPPTTSRTLSASQLPVNLASQPAEPKEKKLQEDKDSESKPQVPIHPVLPVPVPAKLRNKVELVSPKKPSPSLKPLPPDSHSPKNRRFDPSLLRKACSEPNLPLNMADAANYEIKLMPPKARPPSNLSSNRNDFYQNLIKKEQQRMVSVPPSHPSQNDEKDALLSQVSALQPESKANDHDGATHFRGDSNTETDHQMLVDTEIQMQISNKNQVSEEDEERFLRDLGWVPEEEAHVPELTDEEILEVKSRLNVKEHRTTSSKLALDVSVKKWQHDKFFTPLSLSSVDAST